MQPPLPKRKLDSHHPKMQLMEKHIVGQGIDQVGCDARHDLRQNNALERGDTHMAFLAEAPGDLGITGAVSWACLSPSRSPLPSGSSSLQ